jgi:uncharacterized protein (DUF1330 family)
MTVYAIVELEITSMEGMAPYLASVADTIAAHGGKYLVSAGATAVIEGGLGEYPVKVVLEFPSIDAGRGWYDSPEYQAILPHRRASSKGNMFWVDGIQ